MCLDYGGNGVGSCLERVEAERSGWRPNEWIRVETNNGLKIPLNKISNEKS